jgi:hypothetical protein
MAGTHQQRGRPRLAARRGHRRGRMGRVIGPQPARGRSGILAGADFWAAAEPASGADLLLAVVPADTDPGAVMQRVRALT